MTLTDVTPTETATDDFVAALRTQSRRYHDQHPFHRRMNEGELGRFENLKQRAIANQVPGLREVGPACEESWRPHHEQRRLDLETRRGL